MSTLSMHWQGWVNAYDLVRAQKRILLVAAISSTMFGIYIATFCLAIWSSHIDMSSSSFAQRCIRWTAGITAFLMTLRQILNILGFMDTCSWAESVVNVDYLNSSDPKARALLCSFSGEPDTRLREISLMVNIYIPPLVTLLSDGVLAWRVFVAWNRPPWLRYALIAALVVNCVTGLVVAAKNNQQHVIVHQTYDPTMNRYYFAVYTVWAWMAFTLNSTLSAGILIRMRRFGGIHQHGLGGIHQHGLGRYTIVMRAFIESAALSWLGTLSCAVIWTVGLSQYYSNPEFLERQVGPPVLLDSLYENTYGSSDTFHAAIFICLPYLLAMSQVLIITRVNLSKHLSTHESARIITDTGAQWNIKSTPGIQTMHHIHAAPLSLDFWSRSDHYISIGD